MGFWCPNATEPRGLGGKVTSMDIMDAQSHLSISGAF